MTYEIDGYLITNHLSICSIEDCEDEIMMNYDKVRPKDKKRNRGNGKKTK